MKIGDLYAGFTCRLDCITDGLPVGMGGIPLIGNIGVADASRCLGFHRLEAEVVESPVEIGLEDGLCFRADNNNSTGPLICSLVLLWPIEPNFAARLNIAGAHLT